MRAEIGRIFLRGLDETKLSLNACGRSTALLTETDLTSYLNEAHLARDKIFFTKALTTYAFELEKVYNFKYSNTQRNANKLKNDTHRQWDSLKKDQGDVQLVYRFYFREVNGRQFMIDVQDTGKDDQFTYSIHSHSPLDSGGAPNLYLHNVTGLWDVRFVLQDSREQNMEERYGNFAREFFKSLKITQRKPATDYVRDRANPLAANCSLDVHFVIPAQFTVEPTAARVLTKCRYDSRRPGAFLEVTEIEQLDVKITTVKQNTKKGNAGPARADRPVRVSAWSDEVRAMKKNGGEFPFWYELSVGSTKLEEAFRKNESIRVGEKADWDPSEFVCKGNAAFYDMYAPAIEMARQLPELGQYTDNGQSGRYRPYKEMVHPPPCPKAKNPTSGKCVRSG
ncbi:hypothetical protein B0T16DRAFT_401293 [Cercophora newfieldiana]|uniref:Uncharacterized protein n=1 Tax=Cercophora newfieldiana TaxID=92897 RepID=A0AA39YRF1_9PEZI|nr:hypothetical protein B0T16DRAFT_401293 [Cercophora newfieldiana]